MITAEERIWLIGKISNRISDDYIVKTVEEWKERGYENPVLAFKHAAGQGGSSCPEHEGRPRYRYSNLYHGSAGRDRYEVEVGDRKGYITYSEIVEYILNKQYQPSLF